MSDIEFVTIDDFTTERQEQLKTIMKFMIEFGLSEIQRYREGKELRLLYVKDVEFRVLMIEES